MAIVNLEGYDATTGKKIPVTTSDTLNVVLPSSALEVPSFSGNLSGSGSVEQALTKLDELSISGVSEEADELQLQIQDIQENLPLIFRVQNDAVEIPATSFGEIELTIGEAGMDLYRPDAVYAQAPDILDNLILAETNFLRPNVVLVRLYNPTSSAVYASNGDWIITIWRNTNA